MEEKKLSLTNFDANLSKCDICKQKGSGRKTDPGYPGEPSCPAFSAVQGTRYKI